MDDAELVRGARCAGGEADTRDARCGCMALSSSGCDVASRASGLAMLSDSLAREVSVMDLLRRMAEEGPAGGCGVSGGLRLASAGDVCLGPVSMDATRCRGSLSQLRWRSGRLLSLLVLGGVAGGGANSLDCLASATASFSCDCSSDCFCVNSSRSRSKAAFSCASCSRSRSSSYGQ